LAIQIEQDRERKKLNQELEKRFHKTHFGPEETDSHLSEKLQKEQKTKETLKKELFTQMV
jgi:hypothetical protein